MLASDAPIFKDHVNELYILNCEQREEATQNLQKAKDFIRGI